ncbi:hypothetical protein D3C78_1776700 [compost metagenome]
MLEVGRVLRRFVVQGQGMAGGRRGINRHAEQQDTTGEQAGAALEEGHWEASGVLSHQARRPRV